MFAVVVFKLTWGFHFVEKQHLENAPDSPSLFKVLCVNIGAHNDSTDARKDAKVLPESRSQSTLSMVLMSLSQNFNTLTFGKPHNRPIIPL